MLKKLLMMPLMAFALVTLTAATVEDDGEDIFEWEVISENTDLPTEDPDEEYNVSASDADYSTKIYDNNNQLDFYISSDAVGNGGFYYNYNNEFSQYIEDNRIELDIDYPGSLDEYIHIKITKYTLFQISIIGGYSNIEQFNDYAPEINTLETYSYSTPTVIEEIGGALSTIVTAGSSVFVSTFDGLWDVFWDADANDGDGALNWIAYLAVLPVGFFLVRWAFRKVLGIIQQRL